VKLKCCITWCEENAKWVSLFSGLAYCTAHATHIVSPTYLNVLDITDLEEVDELIPRKGNK
jgi:hypothetical protein